MKEFLISYGYGAGWSTWVGSEDEEFALFDKGLIELAKRKASEEEVKEYLKSKGKDFYTGGWEGIKVESVDDEERIRVTEYDGAESYVTESKQKWY